MSIPLISEDEKGLERQPQARQIPIVFFGRLEERKGLCTFIEAIQLIHDPELRNKIQITFLGKVVPLYSAELNHLNSQQYIERELGPQISYEIISNLYSAQAIQYIQGLDHPIVCLTSPQENFPNSALEMGQLPVSLVVSDTGGFRETLQLVNRESGVYWFKPKDAHSLAQMLSKALLAYPETPTVSDRLTLEQVNKTLLSQKLEHIERAFAEVQVADTSPFKITIALTSHNQGKYLIESLSRIEAQNYENVEVIVVDDGSTEEYSREVFEQAKSLFPHYQFIRLDSNRGLGATRNYLADLSTGDYFLPLEPHLLLLPFAVQKFAEAAGKSRAAIVTCPRQEFGAVERIVNFSGGTLPTILKSNVYGDSCLLFSLPFLKKFRHTESKDIQTQPWEIIAAAVATGEKIVCYPYPLYEFRVTPETLIPNEPHPREQYSLRQYLAKIPPSDWSPRQIYMLLTAIQQLQNQPQGSPAGAEGLRSQIDTLQAQLLQAKNEAEQAEHLLEQAKNEAEQAEHLLEQAKNEAEQAKHSLEATQVRIAAMETSKFWVLRKSWFRFKRNVGLPTNE